MSEILTSAISCLLSTTNKGTLKRMFRKRSMASLNFPPVVSWYAICSCCTRVLSLRPTIGTPLRAPASFLVRKH